MLSTQDTRDHDGFPLAPDEIWSNLGKVNIGGQVVPTLGRANFALLLAGHGTKEGWRCLTWVVDFARFIEKHRDLDWSDLLDRARRKGCGRSVLVGCRLAARLLGTRVDADILRLTENDVQAHRTADALVARISNGYPVAALDHDFGDLALCENWLQKARAIKKLIITRTVGDYVSMPLPRDVMERARNSGDLRLNSVVPNIIHKSSALGQIDRQSLTTVGRHAWPE